MMGATIGFDLDMTLVDSRQGILDCMQRVLHPYGVHATEAQLWPLIGKPLEDNLAVFLPPAAIAEARATYRSLYAQHAIALTTPMPGAIELVDAIRADAGTVLVISAKYGPAVHAVLEHVGIRADVVVGDAFAEQKSVPLRQHAADIYVGDHEGDMVAAQGAGAYAVGVTTGPQDATALRAAGADVVLGDLVELTARRKDLEAAALRR